jgi:hypothetical protein
VFGPLTTELPRIERSAAPEGDTVNIVERVKRICLTPKEEWPVIAQEATPPASLITGYVLPLAGIPALAGFIGGSFVGYSIPFVGTYRVPIGTGLTGAVFSVAVAVVGCFLIGLIINALAPTFGAEKNSRQALKAAVYSYTPAWIAGVLQILPMLTFLVIIGSLYGLYLLYLGLPRLMKCPPDKAAGYVVVVIISAIVVSIVLMMTTGMILGARAMGVGALTGGLGGSDSAEVDVDDNSALGKLEQLGQSLEESAKKMEAAEKAGDPQAQAAAAMEGLGALFGGGKRVEPVNVDQLKPFVPETFAGLPRTSSSAEKSGVAGLMVSTAKATYGDGAEKDVTLEVVDTGAISGLVGVAAWVNVQGEREDDQGSERTVKVGNRLIHEEVSKTGGDNEFSVVVAERFIVTARGRGVGLGDLKDAVSDLNLERLEALQGSGDR